LEALSRGAEEVFLIERSKLAYQSLKNNVQKLKLKFPELGEVDYQMEDFKKWMKKTNVLSRADEDQEVYIFFDPPYENTQLYHDFFKIINEVKFKGRVIIEACQQKTMSIEAFEENFGKIDKIFKQGTSYFAIYDF
jgi:16S rRNA G966 N2-methylase RsmD